MNGDLVRNRRIADGPEQDRVVLRQNVPTVRGQHPAGLLVKRGRPGQFVPRQLGAIVLREAPLRDANPESIAAALLDVVARDGALELHWSAEAQRMRERLAFAHSLTTEWPDVSDAALAKSAHTWLLPHLVGLRKRDEVNDLDLSQLLLSMLTWQQRQALDRLAPTQVTVPTGSRIRVDYSDPLSPVIAVRLQELFGLAETPRVGDVALTLHLLSPAGRPVQVTRDLAGFWRSSYFEVRKDLRGRYPKHEWPEDPLRAAPTRRVKPR